MEIVWTALCSGRRNKKLIGQTSILMFPIYGMASMIKPACIMMRKKSAMFRGVIYTAAIFTVEYTTGRFLKNKGICPWDYSKCKYNINGLIRLDYAPAWFGAGLLFERIVKPKRKTS